VGVTVLNYRASVVRLMKHMQLTAGGRFVGHVATVVVKIAVPAGVNAFPVFALELVGPAHCGT